MKLISWKRWDRSKKTHSAWFPPEYQGIVSGGNPRVVLASLYFFCRSRKVLPAGIARVKMLTYFKAIRPRPSNGNDIEAKRSFDNKAFYRSETNKLILKLWRIEAKWKKFNPFFAGSKRTKWFSPKLYRNETKWTRLVQNFTETKQNELG